MIETKNIVKLLGERYILRGVDVSIKCGESIALLGANGAGKSTWLKIVAGLLKPTDGEVIINDKAHSSDDYGRQRLIGFLGHKSFLYDALTPVENLHFYAKLYQMDSPEERIDQLIDDVGLTLFKNERVHTFSRGMIQRLAIARTILHNPKILLLDEPYTGLDQQSIKMFNHIVNQLRKQDTTIVIVTHDFEHIHDVCDRIVMLEKGKVATDELLTNQSTTWIKQLFDGEALTS